MDDLPTLLVSQFLSGLTRAMVYFLIASGLSLVFGAMNVLNFAHGAFYMLGAFFCYSALQWLPVTSVSFFAAVVGAALALAVLGGLIESTLLRRTYALGHVPQILMTYGLALILADLVRLIWGGRFYSIGPPTYLAGITSAGPLSLPTYPHIPESPVGRVHDLDGQVLLLGVGHDADTTLHLAELLGGVPYRVPRYYTVLQNGRPVRIDYGENDHCCERFAFADEWLWARGLQSEGRVGHAHARLARARDIVEVTVERLTRDPLLFLHPPSAPCVECDEARRSTVA